MDKESQIVSILYLAGLCEDINK